MNNELRDVGGGVYKSDYVTVAAVRQDGGAFVATKTPDGTYVGATIPADILVAILESQGYTVGKKGPDYSDLTDLDLLSAVLDNVGR